MVGHEAFARAMVYARSGQVHDVEVDDEALVITGRVKGTYRDDYAVAIHLASSRSGAVSAYRSQCSCPVATDCKHAAAVLIVARHLAAAAQPGRAARVGEDPRQADGRVTHRASRPTSHHSRWSSASSGFRRSGATSDARICGSVPPDGSQRYLGPVRHQLGRSGLRGPLLRARASRAAAAVPGRGRCQCPLFAAAQCLAVPQHGQQRILGAARPGGPGRVDRDHRQAAARSDPHRGQGRRRPGCPAHDGRAGAARPGSPWPATLST